MPGIIVGVDGSGHSQRALEWAVREAAARHAPLTAITVHPAVVSYWGAVTYPEGRVDSGEAAKAARDAVDKAIRKVGQPGAGATVREVAGVPAEELINASAGADMLVVGSRGSGGFARLVMGSVSSQVAHHAPCPVVIVPDQRHS